MNTRRPKTETEWTALRCRQSCKIGRDLLSGDVKPPIGMSKLDYVIFNLLHAIEDLSRQISEKQNEH